MTGKMVRVIYIWFEQKSEYIMYAPSLIAFSASGEIPDEISGTIGFESS